MEKETGRVFAVFKFPIDEMIPVSYIDMECEDLTKKFEGRLELDENYNEFGYYVNALRKSEGAPKALVFQGSYMNEYGTEYLKMGLEQHLCA